ncbi:MAG: OmpH family outer membrane protein [Candidatus Kapabacteria bacterium]|nr:OmpH family outer membrane protein [Candidatus Kapabacteria bacterium]
MNKILIASLLFLFFVFSANIQAQSMLGVVDVETVLKEMPEALDADKKIKEIGQKWQDTLIQLRTGLQQKFEQYQKQKSMMSQDQQLKEEEALQAQNMQMVQYQEEKFGQQGELNGLREELLEPLRTKIRLAIDKVAKEEKIKMVVDKVMVLYSDTSIDITFKVIDTIKRSNK